MPHDSTRAAETANASIAIIGMAGRFADATSLEQLWDMLLQGRDAIADIPPERYDIDAIYDPAPRAPGRPVSRWGGLLHDIDAFDAEFFGCRRIRPMPCSASSLSSRKRSATVDHWRGKHLRNLQVRSTEIAPAMNWLSRTTSSSVGSSGLPSTRPSGAGWAATTATRL